MKFNGSIQRAQHKATMSRHLLALFAILAISCTMTLSGDINEHGKTAVARVEVEVEKKGQVEIDHLSHHGHDHDDHHGDHHDVLHDVLHIDHHNDHHGHDHDDHHGHDCCDHHGHDCNDHHDHHMHKCPDNEMWSECGAGCQATCKDPKPKICPLVCVPGCICQKGMLRNEHNKCVEQCDC